MVAACPQQTHSPSLGWVNPRKSLTRDLLFGSPIAGRFYMHIEKTDPPWARPSWFTGSDELWQLVLANNQDVQARWTFWTAAEWHKANPVHSGS